MFGIIVVATKEENAVGHVKSPSIGLFDLNYTLAGDWSTQGQVKRAWDHAHTVATLQGLVNRKAPRLYTFFVENGNDNIDRYWWNKYRVEGGWLDRRDTLVYPDIRSLVQAFRASINGAVVYDPNVPANSNVASAVAGADGLIAIRFDREAGSLYHQLVETGPRLPVKVWLVRKDGRRLFTGSGKIPGTTRPSSGSAKNDAYRWFIEHYLK